MSCHGGVAGVYSVVRLGGGGGEGLWEDGPGGVVWKAAEIAAATEGKVVRDGRAGSICTDSRKLVPGEWFLALVGKKFDGHDCMPGTVAKGCAGAVGNAWPRGWDRGFVQVEGDPLKALQRLGGCVRRRYGNPVVGITGSVGKTTVRAMTALALESLGLVHQTEGNLNNLVGVPLTLLKMPSRAAACVLELGMNEPGEILQLAAIARPSLRVLLNVGPAHLQNFASLQDVAAAKGELLQEARVGDVCVLNADDPLVMSLPLPQGVVKVLFGRSAGCHVRLARAESVHGGRGVRVELEQYGFTSKELVCRVELEIASPGLHLAINACAAAAVAVSLGIPLEAAAGSMGSKYSPVGMRGRVEEEDGLLIINDAYNANPMSMSSALEMLHQVETRGRKIAILGDMLELGETESASAHARILSMVLEEVKVDVVHLVGPAFGKALLDLAPPSNVSKVAAWETSLHLASHIAMTERSLAGDVILVKGSRGMQMETTVAALKRKS